MTALRRSRSVLGLLLVGAIVGFALGVGVVTRTGLLATQPASSAPSQTGLPGISAHPTSPPTTGPKTEPSAAPDPTCPLPAQLPAPDQPVAVPSVENGNIAMVFTSHLDRQKTGGALEARDETDVAGADWEAGLWYVAAGHDDARLLLAPTGGMVLPLALSQDAANVALWWLPERRGKGEPVCLGGIYVVSTADGKSRLIASGDWALPDNAGKDIVAAPGSTLWSDPFTDKSEPRDYQLPAVSFSTDGQNVAIVDGESISIYGPDAELGVARHHIGSCSDWAWSPMGTTFVAGCEAMTSAWVVDAAEGFGLDTIALPVPQGTDRPRHWEVPSAATIGITASGQVRVARFYGVATGCEVPGCTLPPLSWSVTTIDLATGESVSKSAVTDFIAAGGSSYWDTRLSANASWVYARTNDGHARAIDVASGAVAPAPFIDGAGQSLQSGRLFYIERSEHDPVLIASIGRSGEPRGAATLRLPAGATARSGLLLVAGLLVTLPPP